MSLFACLVSRMTIARKGPMVAHRQAETPPPPLVFVPFRRDPDYVPRAAIMEKIHEKLSVPEARVALVGLGGVGCVPESMMVQISG